MISSEKVIYILIPLKDGDGTLLGAVYVLGPGDQGVVYEHREGTFGDNVNTNEVLQAVQQFKRNN